jgi:hypothetical protein
MDWVRLYHDTPTDPKWRVIARRSGQRLGDVLAVWVFVLCNASCNTMKRGVTHNLVSDDIAAAFDMEPESVTAILDAMEGKVIKNGVLTGWENRNPKREDSSTERVRKFRETHCNAVKRTETLDKIREDKKEEDSLSDKSDPPKPKRARKEYSETFEAFWKAYPTDKIMSKSEAFKSWNKLPPEGQAQAVAAIPAFKAWIKTQRDYRTLHACRFLSQGRFQGFQPEPSLSPEEIQARRDKADRLLNRGKYAEVAA